MSDGRPFVRWRKSNAFQRDTITEGVPCALLVLVVCCGKSTRRAFDRLLDILKDFSCIELFEVVYIAGKGRSLYAASN